MKELNTVAGAGCGESPPLAKRKIRFEIVAPSLARQVYEGVDKHDKPFRYTGHSLYARVRDKGRLTWKSTEADTLTDARKWLRKWRHDNWLLRNGFEPEGVVLQRGRATVAEVLDEYVAAGCPTRKGKTKNPQTVKNELRFMRPVRQHFGNLPAAGLILGDCDKYRAWRSKGGYIATFTVRGHSFTKPTKGGNRIVDAGLQVLTNALNLAVRRGVLKANPLMGRGRYTSADEVRHCREVAPTPEGLQKIIGWLRERNDVAVADLVAFLAYSGLRIGEALPLTWQVVNLDEGLVNAKRKKRGVNPWVAITPELEALLRDMQTRRTNAAGEPSRLLFPSPFDVTKPRDHSAVGHRLTAARKKLKLPHVTPHGLRSYFVTQARQCGLTDAVIAGLIGDKSGPALIASTYGDLRPDHLLAQALLIRHAVAPTKDTAKASHKASHTMPGDEDMIHHESVRIQTA